MELKWDQKKTAANLAHHGVRFDEAITLFDDTLYVDFYDSDHSYDKHSFLIFGESREGPLLIVTHTEREDAVRPISAREITPAERKTHEEG